MVRARQERQVNKCKVVNISGVELGALTGCCRLRRRETRGQAASDWTKDKGCRLPIKAFPALSLSVDGIILQPKRWGCEGIKCWCWELVTGQPYMEETQLISQLTELSCRRQNLEATPISRCSVNRMNTRMLDSMYTHWSIEFVPRSVLRDGDAGFTSRSTVVQQSSRPVMRELRRICAEFPFLRYVSL